MRQLIAQAWSKFVSLLYKRTILILTLLFCVGIAIALSNMWRLSSNLIQSQAVQNSILYAKAIKEARTLYSDKVVDRIKSAHGITVSEEDDDYYSKQGTIPLPATFLIDLGTRLSQNNQGISVRLYSDYPFPRRAKQGGGVKDDFERQALQQLRKNPKQAFYRFEPFKGQMSLRYAQADILKPSCVNCHNTQLDSPKKDWQVGDVRGVLEIITPLNNLMAQTNAGLRGTFITLAILSLLGVFGLTLIIGRLRQTSKELERRVVERTAQLQETNEQLIIEQEKSERLLLNILPETIAAKLKAGQSHIAEGFAEVTILFADIVNFTQLSEQISPQELLKLLNEIFTGFDSLTEKHNLEKIKTIGDAYMVVGGVPLPRHDHAEAIANMALDMQQEVRNFNTKHHTTLNIRIGINTGAVVAGVIGTKKFIYDLWGDAVNTASRMESHGVAGGIQVSEATYQYLQDSYQFESRGIIQVKGKGEMITYLLKGKKVGVTKLDKIPDFWS
ncbi:MAG: adenylate/guanylate cyclase domain-containing protein [Coleofasciculaceae cyanobacterium]